MTILVTSHHPLSFKISSLWYMYLCTINWLNSIPSTPSHSNNKHPNQLQEKKANRSNFEKKKKKTHTKMNSTMSESGAGGFKTLSSPIPYLFGGLAIMLALIAVALLILAWSYRKQYYTTSSNSASDEEKPPQIKMVEKEENVSEPKIVVIMAGESNPTYLAKPVPSTSHNEQPLFKVAVCRSESE